MMEGKHADAGTQPDGRGLGGDMCKDGHQRRKDAIAAGMVLRDPGPINCMTEENQRLWEAYYLLRPAYEPWEGWQRWMREYRTLVAIVQDMYEAQYGRRSEDPSGARYRGS